MTTPNTRTAAAPVIWGRCSAISSTGTPTTRLRPRPDGPTDEEYFREPVADMSNLCPCAPAPRRRSRAAVAPRPQLDDGVDRRSAGVTGLGEDDLARPGGPAEGPWSDRPLAALVLHINRELLHPGAEIALLRDLYAHRA